MTSPRDLLLLALNCFVGGLCLEVAVSADTCWDKVGFFILASLNVIAAVGLMWNMARWKPPTLHCAPGIVFLGVFVGWLLGKL